MNTPNNDERLDVINAASAAFKARGGAPDWEEDAIARDLIIRWHLRGFEDGIASAMLAERERAALHAQEGYRLGENCDDIAKRIRRGEPAVIGARFEPQGEPSDAHDDDCEAEYVVGATAYTDCECRIRASEAERAASEAGGEGR